MKNQVLLLDNVYKYIKNKEIVKGISFSEYQWFIKGWKN